MATFSNQTTNLSNLSTSLTGLCGQFEALLDFNERRNGIDDTDTKGNSNRKDQAKDFLRSLGNVVNDADHALVQSTEYLLPTLSGRVETSRMTATELAQVLSSLHGIHSRQIERFTRLLGDDPHSAEHRTPNATGAGDEGTSLNTPYHWSLGLPLEKVVETDNETDRYSYGSVASIRSRSFSRTPGGKGPSTPLTPSVDGLRLSASTASILTHDNRVLEFDSPEANGREVEDSLSNASDTASQGRDFEAHDASTGRKTNDMLFQPSTSQLVYAGSSKETREYHDVVHVGPQDFTGVLSKSDELGSADGSTLCQDDTHSTNERTKENSTILILEGDTDDDDEVTTLCPTVLANRSDGDDDAGQTNSKNGDDEVFSPQTDVFNRQSIFTTQHDISHVVVQTETSPTQTMLTMDATMLLQDSDAISQSSRLINDAASLGDETPVLDRYRIIPDESSIGFKVLCNERGSQRKLRSTVSSIRDDNHNVADMGIPKSVKFCDKVTSRDKPSSFRKTPYHFKRGGLSLHPEEASPAEPEWNSGMRTASPHLQYSSTSTQQDKENRKSPFHHRQTSVSNDEPLKKSVAFESPFNQTKTTKRSFQKTPFSKSARIDGEEGRSIRFDTSELSSGSITPLKGKVQSYRNRSVAEKLSIEDLKFDTPARRVQNTFHKTPFVKSRDDAEATHASPTVHFADRDRPREFATQTPPLRRGGGFRRTPYRGILAKSPALEEKNGSSIKSPLRFNGSSPISLASTISALTGVTYTDNQRELFPPGENDEKKLSNSARKSVSSLIPKISEAEFKEGGSLQFSREEINGCISALNGAAFLRCESGDSNLLFSDAEAYKILRNVGFRRRNAKGLLMSLCHWRRLIMVQQEEDEFDTPSHCFRILNH